MAASSAIRVMHGLEAIIDAAAGALAGAWLIRPRRSAQPLARAVLQAD